MRRDRAIDALRGVFILMMILGHLGSGSLPERVINTHRWCDAGTGFVLIAGLVLGMVHRRVVARSGLSYSFAKLRRRVVLLFVAHVVLVLAALVVGSTASSAPSYLPSVHHMGGWGHGLFYLVTLQVNPSFLDILSMYAILMALAVPAVALLHHRRLDVLLGLSVALYAFATVWPSWTSLPDRPAPDTYFNWGRWQLLFVVAVAVGWSWQYLRPRLVAPRTVRLVAAAFACLVAANVVTDLVQGRQTQGPLFRDGFLGPGRIVYICLFSLVAYPLVTALLERLPSLVEPVALIGTRSLDCYFILGFFMIAAPTAVAGGRNVETALLTAVCCYAWARFRQVRHLVLWPPLQPPGRHQARSVAALPRLIHSPLPTPSGSDASAGTTAYV